MSKNTFIVDDRIAVSDQTHQLIHVGSQSVTYNRSVASGTSWVNNIEFTNVNVPQNTILDREMTVSYSVEIAFPSNQAGEIIPDYIMPVDRYIPGMTEPTLILRPFPLSQSTSSLKLQLNGIGDSIVLNEIVVPVSRTFNKKYMSQLATECTAALDQSPVWFPDVKLTGSVKMTAAIFPVTTLITGTLDNGFKYRFTTGATMYAIGAKVPVQIDQLPSLNAWFVNDGDGAYLQNKVYPICYESVPVSDQPTSGWLTSKDHTSRGSLCAVSFLQNQIRPDLGVSANGYTVYVFRLSETVFYQSTSLEDDLPGICNVRQLTLNYTIDSLKNMVSACGYAKPIDLNSFFVKLVQPAPQLAIKTFAVNSDIVKIPKMQVVSVETTTQNIMAMNQMYLSADVVSTQQFQSSQVTYDSLPSLIYFYARPARSSVVSAQGLNYSGKMSQNFLALGIDEISTVISLNIGTRQSLLNDLVLFDLYSMSARNGYAYSYSTWLKSPIIIVNPTLDLGIDTAASQRLVSESNGAINMTFKLIVSSKNYRDCGVTKAQRELYGIPEVIPTEACCVAVFGGSTLTIGDQGSPTTSSITFDKSDVTKALTGQKMLVPQSSAVEGGSMFGSKTPRVMHSH
jgi:hypothetical protein